MTHIGFIGLGHMGAPMSKNLLKNAHNLCVYDIVSEASETLMKAGAKQAKNLSEICENAEIIITMLPAGKQVREVCLGTNGLFAHAKPGTLFIDSSSIEIDITKQLADEAIKKNLAMIDAPVSGGVSGAIAATLTFMVGGSEENFLRAKPLLECMGKTVVHTGMNGSGQATKICNNMLLGISMIAVSEAFTLAKKLGLDPQKLFEVSSHSSGQCWSMTSYCPVPGLVPNAPSNNNYQAGFTSAMMLKDLRLSQQAAQNVGAATPLGAEAMTLYTLFNNQGNAELDFSGIIQFIEEMRRQH